MNTLHCSVPFNKKAIVLASSLTILTACGGGGGGGGDTPAPAGGQTPGTTVNLTNEQAKAAAAQGLAKGLSGGVEKFQTVMKATSADNAMAESLAPEAVTAVQLLEGGSTTNNGSGNGVIDQTQGAFTAFLGTTTRNGDVITYTPDAQAVCSETGVENILDLLSGSGSAAGSSSTASRQLITTSTTQTDTKCTDLVKHITLVQTLTSETTGTLAYRFDNFSPLIVGYAPDSSYFQLNLADLKGSLEAGAVITDPQTPAGLPNMSGSLRVTETDNSATKSTLTLSVPDAITINGALDGQAVNLNMAQTTKLLELTGDTASNEASVEFAVNAVNLVAPITDPSNVDHPSEFNMAGITGLIQIAAATDTVTVTNLGLNGQPLTLKIDGNDALRLTMSSLSLTTLGSTKTSTLNSALDVSLSFDNLIQWWSSTLPAATKGTLAITAPANTEVAVIDNTAIGSLSSKITSGGPLTLTGTGLFAGNLSFNSGTCLTDADNTAAGGIGLPITSAACP